MIPLKYNIISLKKIEGKIVPIFSAWPKELEGWWLQITDVSLLQTRWVCQFYFNNTHPEGTVVVSNSILKAYPDMYLLVDHNGTVDRVYINPAYRKRGLLGVSGPILRTLMYEIFNVIVETTTDSSLKTERGIVEAYESGGEHIPKRKPEELLSDISVEDILPPRDPVYPFVWAAERIGGKIESE
jgi:hypothetical protein